LHKFFLPTVKRSILRRTPTLNPSPQGGGGLVHANLSTLQKPPLQSLQLENRNPTIDWQLAITRNREALLTIIVALMKSIGLVDGGQLTTLPRYLYRNALLILRQAESAVRRLIVIAAHEIALRGFKLRKPRATTTNFLLLPERSEHKAPVFNLIEPLKDFSSKTADFDIFGVPTKPNYASTDRTPSPAAHLGQRLLALKNALDSIPQQAKRLARWYVARDLALKQSQPHRLSPMRPGTPPASRRAKRSEMDKVLLECHLLAIYVRDRRDSP
jgi:hypothetical protein